VINPRPASAIFVKYSQDNLDGQIYVTVYNATNPKDESTWEPVLISDSDGNTNQTIEFFQEWLATKLANWETYWPESAKDGDVYDIKQVC
jgi:hypothetical protein